MIRLFVLIIALVGIVTIVLALVRADAPHVSVTTDNTAVVIMGGEDFRVAVADNSATRVQGLSGRTGLPENEGLLFVFERAGQHGIWMKDMQFAIDIIWIDANGAIVHIEHVVAPETFPHIFVSDTDALYVLEVKAGEAERVGVSVGDYVTLPRLDN